jgi:hypothetical protein
MMQADELKALRHTSRVAAGTHIKRTRERYGFLGLLTRLRQETAPRIWVRGEHGWHAYDNWTETADSAHLASLGDVQVLFAAEPPPHACCCHEGSGVSRQP